MDEKKRSGSASYFYRAFASAGSHSIAFCYITLLFVPVYSLWVVMSRAIQYHKHVAISPMTWQEALGLGLLVLLAIASSVFAGAGLKTWMRNWTRLWPSAILQVWIMLQFLIATLELRYFAQNADKLPGSASGPPIAAMTVWVFLVGYLAKIPWDKLVTSVEKRILDALATDNQI